MVCRQMFLCAVVCLCLTTIGCGDDRHFEADPPDVAGSVRTENESQRQGEDVEEQEIVMIGPVPREGMRLAYRSSVMCRNVQGTMTLAVFDVKYIHEYRLGQSRRVIIVRDRKSTFSLVFECPPFNEGKETLLFENKKDVFKAWLVRESSHDGVASDHAVCDMIDNPQATDKCFRLSGQVELIKKNGDVRSIQFTALKTKETVPPNIEQLRLLRRSHQHQLNALLRDAAERPDDELTQGAIARERAGIDLVDSLMKGDSVAPAIFWDGKITGQWNRVRPPKRWFLP